MKNNCTIQIVLAMGLLLVQPILTTGNATTSLAPLIDAIEQADYQQFKLQLAAQQSISPACLNQLLSQALFVSNWPCNPEDTRFPNDIYAIIKLLLERNANLDFMCEYLASGPANEFVDQCGHGTKQVRCSLREFVLSSDYKITAVKDLIRTLANQE